MRRGRKFVFEFEHTQRFQMNRGVSRVFTSVGGRCSVTFGGSICKSAPQTLVCA